MINQVNHKEDERMMKLGQKIEILRMYFVEGKAKKEIARKLNISKNTVKSYINDFLNSKRELINSGVSKYELIENMVDKPKYKSANRHPRVMTDEVKEIIRIFLKDNEVKRNTGKAKMCMTAQDMYEALIEKGFSLSYTSVAQYVQKYKENEYTFEAFIKQVYDYGDVCEFDWGEVKLTINGIDIKYRMAVFTMAKSNFRFACLYKNENSQSFVDAHIRFFEYIGGVPKCMVYDNMKVAVAKFVGRTEKEATDALKKLSVYYGFNYRFCNIRSGNEKGHVENSVDFVRRKAFAEMSSFDNEVLAFDRLAQRLEKYNNIKTKYLNNNSPTDLLNIERSYLSKLMPTYTNCIDLTLRVDKLSTISYLQNRYSVPDYLVLKAVDVKVFIDKLEIFYNNNLVASHTRLYGNQEWSIDILHYTKTLSRKPGALLGSLAFEQMNSSLKEIYHNFFKEQPKSFIALLGIIGDYDITSVQNTIDILTQKSVEVNVENIKMILNRNNDYSNVTVPKSNLQEEIENNARRHLAMYDSVIGTSNVKGGVAV